MLGKKGVISVCAMSLFLVNTAFAQDTETKPNAQSESSLVAVDTIASEGTIQQSTKLQANIEHHTLEE